MKELINQLITDMRTEAWDAFIIHKDALLGCNHKKLIIELLNDQNFQHLKLTAMLLILPEIWKDFSLDDWREIIRSVRRPQGFRPYVDDSPSFEDIKFLYNWINVDSIKLYKEDENMRVEDKKILDKIIPVFLHDTLNEKGNTYLKYKEDFEDGTFGNYEYFKMMKNRLISEGALPLKLD